MGWDGTEAIIFAKRENVKVRKFGNGKKGGRVCDMMWDGYVVRVSRHGSSKAMPSNDQGILRRRDHPSTSAHHI